MKEIAMCETILDKPIQLLQGKTIKKLIQASDCIGQTFIIELSDNLSINIDRNDDNEFFLSIYEDNNPVPLFQTERPWII